MTEENIHPMSGPGPGGKIFDTIKKNPFLFGLGLMTLLALIVPPRKRKYKPKKKDARKRKKSKKPQKLNPVRSYPGKGKKKKSRTNPAPVSSHRPATRTRTTKKGVPAWRVKGSQEARDYMRKLRLKRKK